MEAIPELELPVQAFVVGTAAGMAAARRICHLRRSNLTVMPIWRPTVVYLAVLCGAAAVIAVAAEAWAWSDGVVLAVICLTSSLVATFALRHILFAPTPPGAQRGKRPRTWR
jgi:hypothetical protein